MNVAQLKRIDPKKLSAEKDSRFPRLNERGSIEANSLSLLVLCGSWRFPRLNERGSIEALGLSAGDNLRIGGFHV